MLKFIVFYRPLQLNQRTLFTYYGDDASLFHSGGNRWRTYALIFAFQFQPLWQTQHCDYSTHVGQMFRSTICQSVTFLSSSWRQGFVTTITHNCWRVGRNSTKTVLRMGGVRFAIRCLLFCRCEKSICCSWWNINCVNVFGIGNEEVSSWLKR